MLTSKPAFLKPYEEDRPDVDPEHTTTFVYNPNIALNFEQQKKRLPIYANREHILYLLEQYQTLVLVGETGCGKSTQVPQYLAEAGWCDEGKKVAVTEPRRVAATTLAARVAEEMGTVLGEKCGYSIRFDDKCHPEKTQIKYMTEGILLREMMADPLLRSYSVIMLDEVHERTLYTDIVMGLLKKILRKQKNLRLIVASATVDAEQLQRFFNIKDNSKDSAVIMSVQGRSYPVDIHYVKEPVADYVQFTVETILKIHSSEIQGDILAFLTGQEEVDRAIRFLKEYEPKKTDEFRLLPLPMYGSLPYSEQLKVFRGTPRGLRKVVVATNIAETSITISGIVYVIDCGFVKLRWFKAEAHTDALVIVPVSQASADQRAGRAGRIKPGKAYRLYPEPEYMKLEAATPPEMQRTELAMAVLQLKALGIDNVLRFSFPSPPPAKNLLSAVELLYALGAIDANGNLTKPLGETMAEFPIAPIFSKVLMVSGEMGCSEELLSIMAMLQVQNIFQKPSSGSAAIKARIAKRKFEVAEGDLLTLLNAYVAFHNNDMSKPWCQQNFLNYKGLMRAHEIREQMVRLLKKFNVPLESSRGNLESILRCLTAGFFPNAAYLHHSGVYKTVRGDEELYIHPNSVFYTLQQPQWVLFAEVVQTDKMYMRDLTLVYPEWLEEMAPHFYHRVTEKR